MAKSKGEMTPTKIIEKYNTLKSARGNFENLWQKIAEYTCPRKDDITRTSSPGESKYDNLLDSTAMTSGELLSGSLHGMLSNPSGFFFNLSTGEVELDNNDNVRKYIQEVVRRIHDRLSNSNFHTEVHEYYLDLVNFGNGCMFINEDEDQVISFSTKALKEVVVMENSKGRVDCLYRCIKWTAKDIADEFGEDVLTPKLAKEFKEGSANKHEVIHAIYPRNMYGASKGQAYVSQYILKEDKLVLETSGFNELNFIFGRWSKVSGEEYGRGAGEKALPEAKTVNVMMATTIKAAQKMVDPPLQAPDDGFITKISTRAAGVSYYRSGSTDRIEPVYNNAQVDFGFQLIEMKRAQIREAYYVDQLKLREGPQMTAAEVSERVEQAMRFLGPMLGRQQNEFLQPLIDRVASIMYRKGELPEPPAELGNVKQLKVQFSSVMAMTQRLNEVTNIQRTMGAMAPFIGADPTVLDNYDGDAAARYIGKLFNFPQELIRNTDLVEKMRADRQEAMQAQQQAAMEAQQVDSAAKLAGAASKVQQKGA